MMILCRISAILQSYYSNLPWSKREREREYGWSQTTRKNTRHAGTLTVLAPTLASRAARSASESYGSKRRPQQRTHSRRQLPCTLGAVEPPLHTVLCGASAVASSSCVCVRWMERRGNHRGRGRGQWCGREGGRDNATHSQPLRSGVGEGEGAGEVCAVHTHPARR